MAIDEPEERPEAESAQVGFEIEGYAVSWMVIYVLFSIPIYWLMQDGQNRHYIELANRYLPMGYIAVGTSIVYARISKHFILVWSPVTWFFMASTLIFGMGPLIYYYGDAHSIRTLDMYWIMDDTMLLRTNVLNSVGTLFVCVGHRLMRATSWRPKGRRTTVDECLPMALKMFKWIIIFALPLKLYIYSMKYMYPFDFTYSAFVDQVASLCNVCITLSFFIWQSGRARYAWIAIPLLLLDATFSLLAFSKAYLIIPFIQAVIGIFMARKHFSVLVVGFLVVVSLYMWVKPLVDMGRGEFNNRQQRLDYRVEFVSDFLAGNMKQSATVSMANSEHWWTRQSFNSTEAYMINSYDNGHAGETIQNVWVVFIPRFIWPDKPIVTNAVFDLIYELLGTSCTSVGATLYGEAYWNGGWWMVFITSLYVGAMMCILARFSIYYMQVLDLRWLPVAIMGIYYGLSVEAWFVPVFVGEIPLFVGIWFLMKFLFPIRGNT